MTIKDELHELIDELEDERAEEALALLRMLTPHYGSDNAAALDDSDDDFPLVVSGIDFFSAPEKSAEELAEEQGVQPITSLAELADTSWPEDDSVDELIATVRAWRHERVI